MIKDTWRKTRTPLAFAFAFISSIYLGASGNPLGWGLALLIAIGAAGHYFAKQLSAMMPKGISIRHNTNYTNFALVALGLFAAIYLVTKHPLFALLAFVALVYLLLSELFPSGKGSASELRAGIEEAVIALASAFAVWFLLSALLGTASPLNVVTSCSMQPALDRGDLIILHGGAVNAPVFTTSEPLEGLRATIRRVPCLVNGEQSLCDGPVTLGSQSFASLASNDVIVYEPEPRVTDFIIHRAVVGIDANGSRYYLTKGDNNQRMDQPTLRPVPQDRVQGRVFFRIPLVGYLKLLLFLQFANPEGCDTKVTGG